GRSRARTTSCSRPTCPRRDRGRSCAVFSGTWPKGVPWATPRRSPTRPSSPGSRRSTKGRRPEKDSKAARYPIVIGSLLFDSTGDPTLVRASGGDAGGVKNFTHGGFHVFAFVV